MEQNKKDVITRVLSKLFFVNWDRYFGDDSSLVFFGWIGRKDNYKDFVSVDFIDNINSLSIGYATSSKEFTKKIADILNCEHSECKRVESFCDIDNCIKLEEKNKK